MKRVLVVCAHPDDEAYGPGATILKMTTARQWEVGLITFTDGINCKEDEYNTIERQLRQSCRTLGIDLIKKCNLPDQCLDRFKLETLNHELQEVIQNLRPHIVLTHSVTDLNRDHRLVAEATFVACRPKPGGIIEEVWSYEIPSSTNWAFGQFDSFEPNLFVDIDIDTRRKKLAAVQCYKNELEDYPHPRSMNGIESLMNYRGNTVGFKYAEAFKIIWKRSI